MPLIDKGKHPPVAMDSSLFATGTMARKTRIALLGIPRGSMG